MKKPDFVWIDKWKDVVWKFSGAEPIADWDFDYGLEDYSESSPDGSPETPDWMVLK